ncbi:DUF3820 family protein [Simiduia agarivorans]|uniref:Cytoplasmic protein n=1 Tax=Simiduia agarivorans (strain DSM 21679 / JCM 13881 / BCRC 17597 / SA1) TaxID=1117647 RepID=K4L3X4_SIMAS|nr:DUF3820 family protein [Simiduia agarivorans]AFV00913.1 hypothetical protein M5M_18920 [Simiduia agarivorans SA1 = DSM 21679]
MDYPFPPEYLKLLVSTAMPFGKYQGRMLADLPEPYLVWFAQQGFPKGKLGELLALAHEIKVNGLEPILEPLRGGVNTFNPRA